MRPVKNARYSIVVLLLVWWTTIALPQNSRLWWSVMSDGFGTSSAANSKALLSIGEITSQPIRAGLTQVTPGFLGYRMAVGGPTSTQEPALVPSVFELKQNYPNPFNPSTTIEFSVPTQSHVELIVYSLLGQEVATITSEDLVPGYYQMLWNGQSESGLKAASGVYFCRISATGIDGTLYFRKLIRMLLLK